MHHPGALAKEAQRSRIGLIPPGTVVGEGPPRPWTHLIIKSQPRVTDGDVRRVAASQIRLASLYFMATLARVEPIEVDGQATFRLADLASGIGTRVGDRDVIVSPDTAKRLGADPGFLGGMVLSEMYNEQQAVEVVFRSETAAMWDTPIVIRKAGVNRSHVLRYAAVVDAKTGLLDAFCWLIDITASRGYQGVSGNVQWLAPSTMVDCRLFVDKSEYTLGIPGDNAFACLAMPQGRVRFAVQDEAFLRLLAKPRLAAADGDVIQAGLAKLAPPR